MHGIIFSELKKYVSTEFDKGTWNELLKNAGLGARVYTPIQSYPDEEVRTIVTTAARMTGLSASVILEDFGAFLAPDLLKMCSALLRPEWRTLDVIEHTEAVIHKMVRIDNPKAAPPELIAHRTHPDEVIITYTSQRRLCDVAKGIAKGLAHQFNEHIVISESSCMLKGDTACKISVKRSGDAAVR